VSLHLSHEADWAIRAHAYTTFPEECCGLLVGKDGEPREAREAVAMENVKEDERARRFLIDPLDLMRAEERLDDEGKTILGFYHSHPTGVAKPSEFDRAHAWPWYSYVILAITAKGPSEILSWRLREDRSAFEAEPLVLK
jgi:proteasome lid subunit RPN8/RPN11